MADDKNKKEPNQQDVDLDFDEDLIDAIEDGTEPAGSPLDIDKAIADEDPGFAGELAEISADDFLGVVIEREKASDEIDENGKSVSAFRAYMGNLPKDVKNRLLAAGGVVAVMVPLALLIYLGKILPEFELPYATSMGEITSKVYSYPTDGLEVPLFDPYRTNAFTVPLPKATINLKNKGEGPVYGEFEFFLNLRDKDQAKTIEGRQSELIDVIQRSLEQVSWEEMQTAVGKEKVKKVVRHRINEFLQGNIVLGVYYRSVLVQK